MPWRCPLPDVRGQELEHLDVRAPPATGEGTGHQVGKVEVPDDHGVGIAEGQEGGRGRGPGRRCPGPAPRPPEPQPGSTPTRASNRSARRHTRRMASARRRSTPSGVEVGIAQLGEAGGISADAELHRTRGLLPVAPGQGPERLPGLEAGDLLLQDRRDQDLHQRAGGGGDARGSDARPRRPPRDGRRSPPAGHRCRPSRVPARARRRPPGPRLRPPPRSPAPQVGDRRVAAPSGCGSSARSRRRRRRARVGGRYGGCRGAGSRRRSTGGTVKVRLGVRSVSADGSSPDGSSPCRPMSRRSAAPIIRQRPPRS